MARLGNLGRILKKNYVILLSPLLPPGPKGPRYLPKTITTIPSMESLNTLWLRLGPCGMNNSSNCFIRVIFYRWLREHLSRNYGKPHWKLRVLLHQASEWSKTPSYISKKSNTILKAASTPRPHFSNPPLHSTRIAFPRLLLLEESLEFYFRVQVPKQDESTGNQNYELQYGTPNYPLKLCTLDH